MSRSGRVTPEEKQPEYIVICCKNMTVIVKGFGQRSVGQLLGHVNIDGGIPFNINDIQEIRRARLNIVETEAEVLYPPQIVHEVPSASEGEEG